MSLPGQLGDRRSVISFLRQHRNAVLLTALAGALLGLAIALFRPPLYRSTSWILLNSNELRNSYQSTEAPVATRIAIVQSAATLGPAGQALSQKLSPDLLRERIEVTARTNDVVEIVGVGDSAEMAEEITGKVADSAIAYLNGQAQSIAGAQNRELQEREAPLRRSLEEVNAQIAEVKGRLASATPASGNADAITLSQLTARQGELALRVDDIGKTRSLVEVTSRTGPASVASLLQGASPATRPGRLVYLLLMQGGGFLIGGVAGGLASYLRERRDPRPRSREALSEAVGSPVIGAVDATPRRDVQDWVSYLNRHQPTDSEAWALRQTAHAVEARRPAAVRAGRPQVLVVIALAGDAGALTVAPAFATFAASSGLSSRFVIRQSDDSAVTLWAAYRRVVERGCERPNLHVGDAGVDAGRESSRTELFIVDRAHPVLAPLTEDAGVVLAVSAGSATPSELARVAMAVDDLNRSIDGVVLVNADTPRVLSTAFRTRARATRVAGDGEGASNQDAQTPTKGGGTR